MIDETNFEQGMNLEFQDDLPKKDSARRVMNLYYLIDTSGSMSIDGRIESVNQVMPEVLELMQGISDSNGDAAEIKVSCLCFSTGVHWMYPQPLSPSDFKWLPCTANGLTDLGRACVELEKHMHRDADLGHDRGHFAPAVILLSDGGPNDDFESGIKTLEKNAWFKNAIKVAIAIGTGTDNKALQRFVGPNAGKEAVLQVTDVQQLKDIVRAVSCAVSRVGSSNGSIGSKTKTEELNKVIGENIEEINQNTHGEGGSVLDIKPIGEDIFN